jgi:ubiquinone/menaquinone biosynthesis C-methylase UbiE
MRKQEVNLKKWVVDEFSGENAQATYIKKAREGLWDSENYFFKKYFTKKNASILDLGCGTGRTTIPLKKKGFKVIGLDLVPKMIENAKKIAKKKGIKINYVVGDATNLKYEKEDFDYVLFSNQGWTQIPGKENRLKAIKEIKRVLKKKGIYIFTAHTRNWSRKYLFFNFWQWFRFFILKPIGFNIYEKDYGDRFFKRETENYGKRTYATKQYIHIPGVKEVKKQLLDARFKILHVGRYKGSPNFFICEKL